MDWPSKKQQQQQITEDNNSNEYDDDDDKSSKSDVWRCDVAEVCLNQMHSLMKCWP